MVATARSAKTRGMPPPDENTAVDPTGAAWVVWLVVVGPGLLFVTLTCVRRVAPGELVLVLRRGEAVRVRRNGFVARWPGLERFEPVSTESRVLPLVVRSRTSDGVDVVALADLTVVVRDVEPGSAYAPVTQAARLAEDTVARAVEQLEVESLVDDLEALATRWPDQLTRRLPLGTEATALSVTEVEARLTGGAT
jgi:hypothetical protein